MTDSSMFRMGIDGCVPENFMENEQNMALALFFFCSKIHTHTPTIWWCRRRRPWVFFVSSFLDWEMGCLITRSSVELKLLLSCHRRGEGEGELDVNKETVELKDYTLVITQRTYGHV